MKSSNIFLPLVAFLTFYQWLFNSIFLSYKHAYDAKLSLIYQKGLRDWEGDAT